MNMPVDGRIEEILGTIILEINPYVTLLAHRRLNEGQSVHIHHSRGVNSDSVSGIETLAF